MKNPLRIYHVRNPEDVRAVMTIAAKVVPENSRPKLIVGVAFCNATADRHEKKKGRIRAMGRMNSRHAERIPFTGNSAQDVANLFNTRKKKWFHAGMYRGKDKPDCLHVPHIWRHKTLAKPDGCGIRVLIDD